MKTVVIATTLAALAAFARPAAACGVPNFGQILSDAAKSLEGHVEPIHVPLVIVGAGDFALGEKSLELGWGWGERQTGGLFPGTDLTRVLVGVRTEAHDQLAVSATYGWFGNGLGSFALDLGAEADVTGTRGIGPTGRLTVGTHGIGVRFGGAVIASADPHAVGTIEVVVDVMDLTGQI